MFKELSPNESEKLDISDKKKLIRAIEIIQTTGKHLSQVRSIGEQEFDVEWIGRNFDRDVLYDRINKRVDKMIESGLIEETKQLIAKHGRISNIIDTIGYKEINSYLEGIINLEEAINLLKQNTRHYAKRQLTWFRRNSEIKWNIYPETKKK